MACPCRVDSRVWGMVRTRSQVELKLRRPLRAGTVPETRRIVLTLDELASCLGLGGGDMPVAAARDVYRV